MPSIMYALVDCNNFFVSCERVFNPKLHNHPVIVVSNIDGCIVSRSNEVKKLGLTVGQPIFKIRDLIRQHKISVLPANFPLYGDLSSRVMNIIANTMPEVTIYSIDEAFINLSSMHKIDIYQQCVSLAQKIKQWTGIPVSIGVAPTKTLAKVANDVAKKQVTSDVFYFDTEQKIKTILGDFKIRDVWGIGQQLEKKLHSMGIYSAAELIQLSEATIKTSFNITTQRTILELRGISCIPLKDSSNNTQQIMVSRSFGHRVTQLPELQEAIATYASMTCEKLRKQHSITGGLYVLLQTGLHGATESTYQNSVYISLPAPTADTRLIVKTAKNGLEKLFRSGFRYQKVGVILCDLASVNNHQTDLFTENNIERSENLMSLIDQINQKIGKDTIQLAAAGFDKAWKMQAVGKSKAYTSDWQELPIAYCHL